MRQWTLKKGDPLHLVLSADANLDPTSYIDDHIWSLHLVGGNPPALALQTTYGLRAQSFRIFPIFIEGDHVVNDPDQFPNHPVIRIIETNYLQLKCTPLPGIDVTMEYWVPNSQGCCVKITMMNSSEIIRKFRLDIIAQLTPVDGARMAPTTIQDTKVLFGKTGNLYPLVYLSGGATFGSGPYPSLNMPINLTPGGMKEITCFQAAKSSLEDSFQEARTIAERKWEPAIARLDVYHSGKLTIETGDPDWDIVLALSQRLAFSLAVGPTDHLPDKSFVLSRNPDQGYSLLDNGSDYDYLWNGQSPLETYFLTRMLLPNSIPFLKNLLTNFLFTQEDSGHIDWKPGLAGQLSHLLATPVLSYIAWLIYIQDQDTAFLEKIYPYLLKFLFRWFDSSNDRDMDGFPECTHPFQVGYDDHPLFSLWSPATHALDISVFETPSLASFLYQDCLSLISISRELGREDFIPDLESFSKILKKNVENCWQPETSLYYERDRDSHKNPKQEILAIRTGPGLISIKKGFKPKARLLITISIDESGKRRPNIKIKGRDWKGRYLTSSISSEQMKVYPGKLSITTQYLLTYVDWIDIQDVGESSFVEISTVGISISELSQLLPLWAGIPGIETVKKIIEYSILNQDAFLSNFGLSNCSKSEKNLGTDIYCRIHPIWNQLILEGMLKYGYRTETSQLFTRMVNAIIKNLKDEKCFRKFYDAETGKGGGERNHLTGIIPIGLFLDILGIKIFSPKKIIITSSNPFPWTVTLRFKGTMIIRHQYDTVVLFPDGQSIEVKSPTPTMVFFENDQIKAEAYSNS